MTSANYAFCSFPDTEDIDVSSMTFDQLNSQKMASCVNLTAINDSVYEGKESISFRLTVMGNDKSRVVVTSDILAVSISDKDYTEA